ncbi:MAG: hypothetical protein K9W45_03085 [Candidatus Heimdallarchaeum aukensis]|uniref:Uncharacterized protein n=2 Tax=Candidatus Heimdallarchaeum TaxID=3053649 RepID=A0A9Y1BSG8_9ARCH|nr:MAG: hypothetical protein K9W45_03085 [Candidatus Heimdallarchaeum aukensis]UJG44257.1 MAG: hypothetical protein K9W46_03515 [Candidatus Heimdallarchaeum endolithica]
MKLENGLFFVLDAGEDKYIFTKRKEAIAKIKEVVKNGGGQETKLLAIDCQNDKWAITQVPWQEIAFELIKEEK